MNRSEDKTVELPVYMDNHATTPTDPRVLETMLPFFTEKYGNAASRQHLFGWQAEEAVDRARAQIGELIGASAAEIVFTSGGTESNNLSLQGVAAAYRNQGNHIVTVATEHRAVLDPCRRLEKSGCRLTVLPVDRYGRVAAEQVADAITGQTILVSVMAANNEVGTLQPIADIGRVCKERGVLFHTDAVQATGKIPIDVEAMGVDLLSLSAHKLYGPKGIGALYVRRQHPHVRLHPIMEGGGHERGLRSGTLPVPLIVGFGQACVLSAREMASESARLLSLRQLLQESLMNALDGVHLNGHPSERLAGNLNLSFAHVEADALMMGMKNVAVSSGSACTSASLEPSHVLIALGMDETTARGSLRFGLGRFNTEADVDYVQAEVIHHVRRLRQLSPSYALSLAERQNQIAR
jgi:cysteine desulfurase